MVGACVQGTSYLIRYFLLLLFIKTKDIRIKEFISNGMIIINTMSALVGALVVIIIFEKHFFFICTDILLSIWFHLAVVCVHLKKSLINKH